MSGAPALHTPARSGLLGVLKSWLQADMGPARASVEDLARETGESEAQACGSARILVVDDNPVNLMVASAQLESRGLVPWLAADGAEAVALACELPFDLILMDLQMPVLDGLGATTAIRRFESTLSRPAVPVVAYTSLSPSAVVLAGHGLNGSLAKPCDDKELEACLVQWCPDYRPAAVRSGAHGSMGRPPAGRASSSSQVSLR